jgi:hypothetical protein
MLHESAVQGARLGFCLGTRTHCFSSCEGMVCLLFCASLIVSTLLYLPPFNSRVETWHPEDRPCASSTSWRLCAITIV